MPPTFDAVTDGADVVVPIAFTPERLAMYDEHFLDLYRPDGGGRQPGAGERGARRASPMG